MAALPPQPAQQPALRASGVDGSDRNLRRAHSRRRQDLPRPVRLGADAPNVRASHGLSAAENAAVPSFRSEAPSLALARRMGCCMPTNLQVLPLVTHGISMGTGAFWRRDALPPASPGQCRAMSPFVPCGSPNWNGTNALRRVGQNFSFEPGVYQRQSLVVDLGAAVPRDHRLGSLVRTCRRRTPPATPVWPTFFAPQRTHAPKPFRPR